MNNTVKLLERVRARCTPTSKNALAKAIGAERSNVRRMYRTEGYPNPLQAMEIAKLLHMDLKSVLGYIQEDKAKSAEAKERVRQHLPRILPALGLALTMTTGIHSRTSENAASDVPRFNPSIHYAYL